MGRDYASEMPDWVWNRRMRSKVRGWVAFHYDDEWEGKRAMISWAKEMRRRGEDIFVTEREINIVRSVIRMRNRLIYEGFL